MNNQQDPTTIITCANADLGCTGPQTDPAVRQAINLVIDRSAIAEKAFAGLPAASNPAFVLLPRDEQWLGDPANGESPQSPDVAEAQAILEEAGYTKGSDGFYGKDGKAIELDLFSPDGWTDYNDAAKLISEEAAKAGLRDQRADGVGCRVLDADRERRLPDGAVRPDAVAGRRPVHELRPVLLRQVHGQGRREPGDGSELLALQQPDGRRRDRDGGRDPGRGDQEGRVRRPSRSRSPPTCPTSRSCSTRRRPSST